MAEMDQQIEAVPSTSTEPDIVTEEERRTSAAIFNYLDSNGSTLRENRFQHLSDTLEEMRQDAEMTDVTLVCENVELPVHKFVLLASSPYFVSLFESGMQESLSGRIVFRDMKSHTLRYIVDYLYKGDLRTLMDEDTTEMALLELLKAAHLMQLDALYNHCWDVLMVCVRPNKFMHIWMEADKYNNEYIQEKIVKKLAKQFCAVKKSQEFLNMPLRHLKLLLAADLTVDSVEDIVCAILHWVNLENKRKRFLYELLLPLDLDSVPTEYLRSLVKDENLVTSSPKVRKLLMDAATKQWLDGSFVSPKDKSAGKDVKLYVFGVNQVGKSIYQAYDVHKNTWSAPVVLPFYVKEGTAIAQKGKYIYFAGGRDGKGQVVRSLIRYDPATNSVLSGCQLNEARWNAAIVGHFDKLFVVGGQNENGILRSACRYSSSADQVGEIDDLNAAVHSAVAVVVNDNLYIVGGCTEEEHTYHIEKWWDYNWHMIPAIEGLGEVRGLCAPCKGKIYIIQSSRDKLCLTYDEASDQWEAKSIPNGPVKITKIWGICTRRVKLPFLLVTECTYSAFYKWYPETGSWTKLPVNGKTTYRVYKNAVSVLTYGL